MGDGGSPIQVTITHSRTFYFCCGSGLRLLRDLNYRLVRFDPLRSGGLPGGIGKVLLNNNCPRLCKGRLTRGRDVLRSVEETLGGGVPYLTRYNKFVCLRGRVRSTSKGI